MSTSTEIDRVIKGFYCIPNLQLWDVITNPYPILNDVFAKVLLKLVHGWVIIFHGPM